MMIKFIRGDTVTAEALIIGEGMSLTSYEHDSYGWVVGFWNHIMGDFVNGIPVGPNKADANGLFREITSAFGEGKRLLDVVKWQDVEYLRDTLALKQEERRRMEEDNKEE